MFLEKIVEKLCYDYPNHTFTEVEQEVSVCIILDSNIEKPLITISKSLLLDCYNHAIYKAIKEALEEKMSQVGLNV